MSAEQSEDKKTELTLLEKLVGCFYGIIIGDAMGMPWEMMTHKEIMFATRGRGIPGFHKPVQLKIRDTFHLQPGDYTDDWQLTRAVARSLIAYKAFNLMDMIKEHLIELEASDIGFGKSTKSNLEMLLSLARGDWKLDPQFPVLKAEELQGAGAGNGVAMKIAPLAIFLHNHHDQFLDTTIKLANLTHRDPQAMLSAYALGIMIGRLYEQSIGLEGKDKLKLEIQELIQQVITETVSIQHDLLGGHTQFSNNLLEVGRIAHNGKIADIDLVRETIGTSCYCAESIPFAMAMFLRHPTDFQGGLIETINCGGDTDSNGSMFGALCGTNLGAMAIPQDWRTFRKEYEEAGYLALTLHNVMYK